MLRSILNIGSNDAMNYLIQTVLNNSYELIIVKDVFHAIAQLQQKKDIHTIIIDFDFHSKESTDFILHINSSKLYNKPLIGLVSQLSQNANASLIQSCFYQCFVKPFNPIDLVNTINGIDSLKPSTFLS